MTQDPVITAPSRSRIPQLMLALILALAAFVQLTVVSRTVVDTPLRADAGQYFSYAFNLKHYGVYSSAPTWQEAPSEVAPAADKLRSPGYPLFLLMAGSPEPTEAYLTRITFLQAGLGILSVWLAYLIAASFMVRQLALGVALIAAVNPHLTTVSTYLLTESLFLFLLLASTFGLIRATRTNTPRWFIVTGLLWGLCSLVRPTTQFFPVLMLMMVFALPSLRKFSKHALVAFACFAVVLSPWLIRNQSVPGSGSGLMVGTLVHGSYPDFMFEGRPETFAFPYRFDPEIAEKSRDLPSALKYIGGRFVAEPGVYLRWYLLGKPHFFLSLRDAQSFDVLIYPTFETPYFNDIRFAVMRKFSILLHWPLMASGLLAIVLLGVRPNWLALDATTMQAAKLVSLIVIYAIGFHMIVAPFPRYAIPFRPLLFALAVLPARALWVATRHRTSH